MIRMWKQLIAMALLCSISVAAKAQYVLAPPCLVTQLTSGYTRLASTAELELLRISETGLSQLIQAKTNHSTRCGGFLDVTEEAQQFGIHNRDRAQQFLKQQAQATHKPHHGDYHIQYPNAVNALLKDLNPTQMWDNLSTLTAFKNRHAKSAEGKAAADWFKTQIETLADQYHRDDVHVSFVKTNGYQQPSVVVKVGNTDQPGIVISAHMDTIVMFSQRQPGADDDGSGSVTTLETARNLLASGMKFKKPIYFIWYAAEEEGLVGSKFVVNEFKKKQIPVDAVLHFDMTGYAYKNEPSMWVMTDYVDEDLTNFIEQLIKTYVKQPVKHSECGYACSDHATWDKNGYPAAIAAEAAYEHTNKAMHTTQDTMDKLSLSHMTDYAKLASAFAVELAEPITPNY